ncbi:hypothetical protein SAMN05444157_1064 [Frankineae bacterium MT45]|nr:hypothetical protein SAMN05444157_1064 [Frankineae bacterium MT45]
MASGVSPQDRVLTATRVLAGIIAPVLVLAFFVLVPWPSDTKRLFAWDIKPSMSAMVLGSVYLGGAYFFVRVLDARRWHTVAGGFLPVATFAGLMGITTILHWQRFIHGNLAFWLWVALYFTTPFLVLAVFLLNQRQYLRPDASELQLTPLAATIIVAAGGLSVAMSAFLYLFPYRAISIWPWHLTPLTARMMGAIFALGLAGLAAARDRRWSSARILLQVAGFMLLLILVAAARARTQFDTSKPLTWIFLVGFVATLLAGAALYLRMARLAAPTRGSEPGSRPRVEPGGALS